MSDHEYMSTACLHETEPGRAHLHRDCALTTRRHDGTRKAGATCKWCAAPCACPRHRFDSCLGTYRSRVDVYVDWRDWWIGVYRGPDATYICAVPCLVIRVGKIDRSPDADP